MYTEAWRKFAVGLIRVFIFAFFGVFIPGASGVLAAPNWNAGKAAAVAVVSAAIAAGIKAVADALTKGQAPAVNGGILPPEIAP